MKGVRMGDGGNATNRTQTILLVEDNFDNLSIYRTVLQHFGYEVLSAEDGVQGLALAQSASPDLILMDISIPGIDGWQATRTIKADPQTSSIPVIVLTAHVLAGDRERAFREGADDYIAKPAEPMHVLGAVQRMLSGEGPKATPPS